MIAARQGRIAATEGPGTAAVLARSSHSHATPTPPDSLSMRAGIRAGSSKWWLVAGRLIPALIALCTLVACTGQAAAVPQNPTRIVPRSSAAPRPPTPEPWPKGWLEPYCEAKDAVNAISERIRDVSIKFKLQGDFAWVANQLIGVASRAESALRRVPNWKKAQPLIDAYWEVARKTRRAGLAFRRYIQRESMSAAEAAVKAANEADLAAVRAVIKTGQINPSLHADCSRV
jgi:hypothetical protein